MTRLIKLLSFIVPAMALGALVLTQLSFAQTPAVPASQPAKIKLVVVTGGHGFNQAGFVKFFDNFTDVDTTIVAHSKPKESADGLERPEIKTADVVLLYDAPDTLNDDQKKIFLGLVDRGAGIICFHHALLAYQHWPDYERIVGGKYLLSTEKIADKDWPESTYQGNADIHVTVAPQKHPITVSLSDFDMKDEIYRGVRTSADITPLLVAEEKPLAWARTEKQSRVVSMIIGHGAGTWSNPNCIKFMHNAILWTAKRDPAP